MNFDALHGESARLLSSVMSSQTVRKSVRRAGRSARQSLTGDARVVGERRLIGHLQSLAALQQGSVGVFVAHDGEPDLAPLVDWLWSNGVTVALPVLNDDPSDFTMRFVPWHRDDKLQTGRFDIPVPADRDPIVPDTLLVSLVAFDVDGNRMGRGAGFFDRYLALHETEVVGVGFEAQRIDQVPSEPHDMALPSVVTDLGIRFVDTRR